MIGAMETILKQGVRVDDRPSRHNVLMATAHAFALRSSCSRGQNGAVITLDGRILSTGYNGAPAGMPHCDHTCNCPASRFEPMDELHYDGCPADLTGCTTAIHAEANAIAWAARCGVATKGTTIYCTSTPCINCARLIINAGIEVVVYLHPYRLNDGLELLRAAPSIAEVYQL